MISVSRADINDLYYGMSIDEANKVMGKDGIQTTSPAGVINMGYTGQSISCFDDVLLVLGFRNNKLYSKSYVIENNGKDPFVYLTKALALKYGQSDRDVSAMNECLSGSVANVQIEDYDVGLPQVGQILQNYYDFNTWRSGNIIIGLFYVSDQSIGYTILFYNQSMDSLQDDYFNLDDL